VIAFAEPVESTCAGLEPNLVWVEFDDDAMAEAMREMAEPYDDDRPRDTKLRQRHASGHDVDTKLGFGHELRLPTGANRDSSALRSRCGTPQIRQAVAELTANGNKLGRPAVDIFDS
jgi:hypothetical protein